MKWFIVLLVLVGAYVAFMFSSANMLLNQTAQLQSDYRSAGQRADQVAAGATFSKP